MENPPSETLSGQARKWVERSSPQIETLFDLRSPIVSPNFVLGMLEIDVSTKTGNDQISASIQKNYFSRLFQQSEITSIENNNKNLRDREKEFVEKTISILETRLKEAKGSTDIFKAKSNKEYFEKIVATVNSWRDNLTGLYNRKGFLDIMKLITTYPDLFFREIKKINPHEDQDSDIDKVNMSQVIEIGKVNIKNKAVSVIFLDLDHFKNINDTYGHSMGDEVLKRFSGDLVGEGVLRSTDLVMKYGGEEIVIFAFNTDANDAIKVDSKIAERVRKFIIGDPNDQVELNFSAGSDPHKTWQDLENFVKTGDYNALISDADKAVYKSKKMGRGRITTVGD